MSSEIACPHCGRLNECHEHTAGHDAPSSGDVAVCWGCRGISVFDESPFGLTQRMPTADERAQFDVDPDVQSALAAMRASLAPELALDALRGSS